MHRSLALLLAFLFPLHGCGDSGVLEGAGKDLAFVTDDTSQIVTWSRLTQAYEVRTLRGTLVRELVRSPYPLADINARADRLLLRAQLGYVVVRVGRDTREFPVDAQPAQFGVDTAALSASGDRIVETRPWECRIRIWSFDTLEMLQELPCPAEQCMLASWDPKDENILWVGGCSHGGFSLIDLTTGKSGIWSGALPPVRFSAWSQLQRLDECRKTGERLNPTDEGIELWQFGRPTRKIVRLRGRRDSLLGEKKDPFEQFGFIGQCRYVFFEFRRHNYLADVQTGKIGPFTDELVYVLADGYGVF